MSKTVYEKIPARIVVKNRDGSWSAHTPKPFIRLKTLLLNHTRRGHEVEMTVYEADPRLRLSDGIVVVWLCDATLVTEKIPKP